ncbi:GGDEF domain-containing protein [Kineococcus sp. SYSU DK005]|uniref:GGDEF domain-containing protein n=1 Tax=Kineococcus sp. SYSU DK005 TaxID=3383126 RepID=UPI003D7DA33B
MPPRARRPPAWAGFLVVGAAAATACLLADGVAYGVAFAAVSLAGALAVVVGTLRHRPRRPRAWWLLAAGTGLWAAGDLSYSVLYDLLGSQAHPALPDLFYLAAYPALGAGLLRLARDAHPARDAEGVLDATTLAVGAGVLSWSFLLRPVLGEVHEDPLGALVTACYPVGDVFLLAVLGRLLPVAGTRSPSFRLLVGGVLLMLLADAGFQLAAAAVDDDGSLLDPAWLGAYLLWGAAALHPSMRRLSDPAPAAGELGRARLLLLAGASLLAPGTLALQLLLGQEPGAWSFVLSSTVLFLLVVARLWTLLGRLRAQTAQLADLARTDALTGLPNRRSADEHLDRAAGRADAGGAPLALALLDLDRFKQFNDAFGHPAGDALLAGAAAAWRAQLSGTGVLLARWGGEEFLVAAEGPHAADLPGLLQRLRAVVPGGRSFSAGVAHRAAGEPVAAVLARADAALYAAKAAGRGCTRTARTGPADRADPADRTDRAVPGARGDVRARG